MKQLQLSFLCALLCLQLGAQTIRTNYRSKGMTHISTAYQTVQVGEVPVRTRVELVGFPDGSTLYLLHMILEQKTAPVVPKGVKMAVTLSGGKILRLEQIGQGQAAGRLKFAAEAADMEQMVRGIRAVDIVTGWNPDDFVQGTFAADELGTLLKNHCAAIRAAAAHTVELQASLSGYTQNSSSILSTAQPIVARGAAYDYNVLLSHLYYKDTGAEDMDLAFVIGSSRRRHIPYDAAVRFTLRDSTVVTLQQARDDENFVYLYPSLEDLSRMATVGVAALSIDCEDGPLEDRFPASEKADGFSDAVNQQCQLLLSLSPQ